MNQRCVQIEPLQNTFREDKENFPGDCVFDPSAERARSLNRQISLRSEVWGEGYWSDELTERIAKYFAKLCEDFVPEIFRAAFIPKDTIALINEFCDDLDFPVFLQMTRTAEIAFGCRRFSREEVVALENQTFGDFVEVVKTRMVKLPPPEEPRKKSAVSAEQLASLEVYEKASDWSTVALWVVVLVLAALLAYSCYIRHPWGIVPALGLCYIGFWVLYQRCSRFAKFVDRLLG